MNAISKTLLQMFTEQAKPDADASLLSRRKLLLGSALLAGFTEKPAHAAPQPSNLQWLIDRMTFGYTQDEQVLADTLGYEGYLDYHLNYQAIDDSALEARLHPVDNPHAYWYTLQGEPYNIYYVPSYWLIPELIEVTLFRAVYSRRQLYERMVEFWTDHFNIHILKENCQWIKTVDDREVIRPWAMTTFGQLLHASTKSPAMLHYLDNDSSYAGNPNENYARELMELHTLGVDGGYTQQDVVEVARCFTGWGIAGPDDGLQFLRFKFYPQFHDYGQKTVLGQTIPAGGGLQDAEAVVNILINHPSTARFIATKLCKRFWSESPPQSLIDAVAATYTATGGDIKSMLRTLFTTLDPMTSGAKYKRPFHMVASSLRATNAEMAGPLQVTTFVQNHLRQNGHLPFHWETPDGYPDKTAKWIGLGLPRWNFAMSLVQNGIPNIAIDIDALLNGAQTDQQVVDRINVLVFGGRMPAADQQVLLDYLAQAGPESVFKRGAVGMALSSPIYQWY